MLKSSAHLSKPSQGGRQSQDMQLSPINTQDVIISYSKFATPAFAFAIVRLPLDFEELQPVMAELLGLLFDAVFRS